MVVGKKRRRSSPLSLVAATAAYQPWGHPHHYFVGMKSIANVAASARSHIAMFGGRRANPSIIDWVGLNRIADQVSDRCTTSAFAFAKRPFPSTRMMCVLPPIGRLSQLNMIPIKHRPYYATVNSSPPKLFGQSAVENHAAEINEESWASFSDGLKETLELPSISVPAKHVHWLLSDKHSPIKHYLATCMVELEGVHPKIKIVKDCEGWQPRLLLGDEHSDMKPQLRRKRILLDSHLALGESIDENAAISSSDANGSTEDSLSELTRQLPGMPVHVLKRLVDDFDVTLGDTECIHILYQNQPISRILSKILPLNEDDEDGMQQSPPSSYEQIGHVAHVNLRKPHVRYGKIIGRVMLDRLRPSIRTVVNKLGEVGGPYRTYEMDLLAGDDDYLVRVVEHGVSLDFDLRKVYWCTRLEGDRTHMMQNEFRPNQLIADAFCGVGALCIRAATALGCAVVANDLNPDAVAYCGESARLNGIRVGENIDDGRFHVQCGDAREFIMNLGIGVSATEQSASSASSIEEGEDDSDDVVVPPINGNNLPDHLLLNFPLDSPKFLNALRWWPSGCDKIKSPPTRVHVYTFSRGDDERTASDVAIDMVADGLLPEGGYVEPSKFRGGYLDELGCNVQAREVRDAAPGKAVICVSFSVTRLLLRRMQGDYGLVIRD
jgi:tRNA G37 N-methylase Trm5